MINHQITTAFALMLLNLFQLSDALSLYRRAEQGGAFSGDGTYFTAGAGQGGACALYNPIPAPQNVDVVAMNTPQWAESAVCGACVEITGALGTAIARVVDRCPPCEHGALDLSEELFPKIDDPAKGRVPITWKFVPCPDSFVQGSIEYLFQDGSTEDWFAFQVRNHRLPIQSVEISTDGGATFKALERTSDNFFRAVGVGAGPYDIRVTSNDGQSVTDAGIAMSPGQTVSGSNQFA